MKKEESLKKNLNNEVKELSYSPSLEEQVLQTYVQKRKDEMSGFRRSLGIEKEWQEADIEYVPNELEFGTPRKRFETDQDTGLRSRMVPIGDQTQNWRSNNSAPFLLIKIQTAFSVLIDKNPEAMLTALSKRYDGSTALAYSLWKRNWSITDAKEILKLIVFDLLKYGWAVGRSFPKKIEYPKKVLVEFDETNPEKNVYEDKILTWFNDVARERLNPYTTWIDENAKPYDRFSTNDCYYEVDFSYDELKVLFGNHPNFKYIKPDSKVSRDPLDKPVTPDIEENLNDRKDIVTLGFYENRLKDLFVIWAPKDKIILNNSPLPNDDGYLSLWHTPWILRSSDSPYGISVWKLIKQDKASYDKFMNMTDDQLVLSIMKFGYHTGTSGVLGDGVINIVPGQSKQITNGDFNWMEIPGPGEDSWRGLEYKTKRIDEASGITPTIEGELTGKTLGEIQLAREAALKRLKTPLDNIAWAIEQDAYLSLSWMKQIYSTPEIKEFANEEELMQFQEETGMESNDLYSRVDPQSGEASGLIATYYPELSLHLEDREGQLFESKESKFFTIGKDISPEKLDWRGIFKVIPRSILDNSETIMKQVKLEMANLLIPLLSQPAEIVMKTAIQICKVNEEDPRDWLPDVWFNPPTPQPPQATKSPVDTINYKDAPPDIRRQLEEQAGLQPSSMEIGALVKPSIGSGAPAEPELFVKKGREAQPQPNQNAETAVPKNEISGGAKLNLGSLFK